jgi:hypothetical protein
MNTKTTAGLNRSKIALGAGLLLGALVMAVATDVGASTTSLIGGFAGGALDSSSPTCFAEWAGAVTGTGAAGCVGTPFPSSPRWEVNLRLPPVATSTFWNVNVEMKGDGAGGPRCAAYTVDQMSSTITSAPWTTVSNSTFTPVLFAIRVPADGQLYLACDTLTKTSYQVGRISWASQ